MKINNFLIIYVKERDLLFYRIGCIIGIIIFPILIYTYEYMYIQPYPYISITIPLMILYLMFVLVTIINKLKKYAYLFAVLSIYETTLFLIFLMVMMGFQQNIVLATAITISTLASGFKTQKVMDTYLVSMILLSIIAILFYLGFSPEAFIAITPLLVWPTLIYYMLKSKYLDESNLKKNMKFLEMTFKSIKEPTILLDSANLEILNCSESAITKFHLRSHDNVIGKTIKEVDNLYFNGAIGERNLIILSTLTYDKIDLDLCVDNEEKCFECDSSLFYVDNKSYILLTISDITDKKIKNKEIYNMAFIDELTQIDNRRSGIKKLNKLIADCKDTASIFALCYIDIDDFKNINDDCGHECGDEVLNAVASRLNNIVKETDVVSRLGGDELMLVIDNLKDKDNMDLIAKRIIKQVGMPIKLQSGIISITISMGISIYPNNGINSKLLMKNADKALYESKAFGKNQYRFFKQKNL